MKHVVKGLVCVILLTSVYIISPTNAQTFSWCPVTQPAILNADTTLNFELYPYDIDLTYRDSEGISFDAEVVLPVPGLDNPQRNRARTHLAYVKKLDEFNVGLFVIELDRRLRITKERLLVTPENIAAVRPEVDMQGYALRQFAWLPGKDTLVFTTYANYSGEIIMSIGSFISADDLWTVDLAGRVTNLLPPGEGGYFTLSPDGAYAVLANTETLQLYNFATGETQPIILENYQLEGAGAVIFYPPVHWLPDSSAFVIAMSNSGLLQHDGRVDVWQVTTDAAIELVGTHNAFKLSFSIAPDGRKVAYWRTESEMSDLRIMVIASLDGREIYELPTAGRFEFDRWLADSEHFIYSVTTPSYERITAVGDVCQTIPLYSEGASP